MRGDMFTALEEFRDECLLQAESENGQDRQIIEQAKGEQFLQNAEIILRKAEQSDARVAKFLLEEYIYIQKHVKEYWHVYKNRLQRGDRMRPGVDLCCAFYKRFLEEVLKPWYVRFLQSVNLSEQLMFMERELTDKKLLNIEPYKDLFYHVLYEKTKNKIPTDILAELHSLQDQIIGLTARFKDSDAYNLFIQHGNESQLLKLEFTMGGLNEITDMIGEAIEPYRRALAMAMGLHSRLGGHGASPFAGLTDDMMWKIAEQEGHSWHRPRSEPS